ncbi:MAG: hypothetical protein AAFY60_11400, partial [Myxococcota bacterium]
NFNVEHYSPEKWRPHAPYVPLNFLDPLDSFWAAKKVIALTPDLLDAAATMAQYESEDAHHYVVKTLRGRAEKLARWAFSQVSPLDRFTHTEGQTCFKDLSHHYGLLKPGVQSTVEVSTFDYEGAPLEETRSLPIDETGRACFSEPMRGENKDGYTIVRLSVSRNNEESSRPPVEVHLANSPSGEARIVGVFRTY